MRVFVVEDHTHLRDAVIRTLSRQLPDISLCGFRGVRHLENEIRANAGGCECLIVDYFLDDGTAEDVLAIFGKEKPETVIVISGESRIKNPLPGYGGKIFWLVKPDVFESLTEILLKIKSTFDEKK